MVLCAGFGKPRVGGDSPGSGRGGGARRRGREVGRVAEEVGLPREENFVQAPRLAAEDDERAARRDEGGIEVELCGGPVAVRLDAVLTVDLRLREVDPFRARAARQGGGIARETFLERGGERGARRGWRLPRLVVARMVSTESPCSAACAIWKRRSLLQTLKGGVSISSAHFSRQCQTA